MPDWRDTSRGRPSCVIVEENRAEFNFERLPAREERDWT